MIRTQTTACAQNNQSANGAGNRSALRDGARLQRWIVVSLFAFLSLCLAAGRANATNGYWPYGFGTASKGMAGAGVALALDSLAIASNPAAMVQVGDRVDLSISFLHPPRGYTIGPGALFVPHSQDSDDNLFPLPSFGWNKKLSDGQSSIGIAAYVAGLNTNYPSSAGGGHGTFLAGKTGIGLYQLFVAPTYARQFGPNVYVGISGILAAQRGNADGFGAFAPFSNNAAALTNKGGDYAYGGGVRLGAQLVFAELTLGVSYQTKIYMSDFKDYEGLLPEGGNFSAPANGAIGVGYKFSSKFLATAEVERIFYSEVPVLGNSINNLFAGCAAAGGQGTAGCFGGSNGPGLGWRDVTVLKLGGQYAWSDSLTLRLGYSHANNQIPAGEAGLNVVTPAVVRHHLTTGLTYLRSNGDALNVSLGYALPETVRGQAPLAFGGHPIELRNEQLEVEFGYSWHL